ncbi:predicted protein [Streptomyces iranensis]|uniref:Uncharacterized protein n=1 Tax=Streptomyces iranensis TaxID=576784 RepID=A0A060ZGB2_9ACTN|nr:predicted protein [Streptomyces iranensis]
MLGRQRCRPLVVGHVPRVVALQAGVGVFGVEEEPGQGGGAGGEGVGECAGGEEEGGFAVVEHEGDAVRWVAGVEGDVGGSGFGGGEHGGDQLRGAWQGEGDTCFRSGAVVDE